MPDIVKDRKFVRYSNVNRIFVEDNCTMDVACKKVGITRQTYYNYKKIYDPSEKVKKQTGGGPVKENAKARAEKECQKKYIVNISTHEPNIDPDEDPIDKQAREIFSGKKHITAFIEKRKKGAHNG